MKILILSDSHGRKNLMLDAIDAEEPELIIHLGDYDKDCAEIGALFPQIPLRSVRGNCDYSSSGPDRDEFVLEGKRFYMTHGHLHSVKTGLSSLIAYAGSRNIDIALFGHTHIPHYSVTDGVTLINPGSIGIPSTTYAVLDIQNGVFSCFIQDA